MRTGPPLIGYASNTGTLRNLRALEAANWRLLVTPTNCRFAKGFKFRFGIDNDAWRAYSQGIPFDEKNFSDLVERFGSQADFVIIPDIVTGGLASFEFSRSWLPRLRHLKKLLLPLQDGMTADIVGSFLRDNPQVGLFLGGSTEWKLREMFGWGMVAHAFGRHYHIGRVNSKRRIQLAHEAGAWSFDGSGPTRYAKHLEVLEPSRRQPRLFTACNSLLL